MPGRSLPLVLFAIQLLLSARSVCAESPYFGIQVVDEETGRGVPLVELKAVNDISYWTESM